MGILEIISCAPGRNFDVLSREEGTFKVLDLEAYTNKVIINKVKWEVYVLATDHVVILIIPSEASTSYH